VSFVKPAIEAPNVKEGQVLKAKINSINKVTSQWKDTEGNLKQQLEFDLELENGYKFKSWVAFYEQPSAKSKLGKLALKLEEMAKKTLTNIDEFLTNLKSFGHVFVKCKGFREYEEEIYPNFTIVTEKLPISQMKVESQPTQETKLIDTSKIQAKEFNAKALLGREPFISAIKFGLPLNESDFTKNFLVEERLFLFRQSFVEKREDLYHFTSKANTLFQ